MFLRHVLQILGIRFSLCKEDALVKVSLGPVAAFSCSCTLNSSGGLDPQP